MGNTPEEIQVKLPHLSLAAEALGDLLDVEGRHRAVMGQFERRQGCDARAPAVSFPCTTGMISKSMRSDHSATQR